MEALISILLGSMIFSTPIIITAIGGLFSEKSGIVNIGLEGMMTFGAFLGATVIALIDPSIGQWALLIGILAGALGGGLFGVLHAYLSITIKADQIISGTVINLLALSLAVYLCQMIFGSADTPNFMSKAITVGDSLYLITIFTMIITVISWFVLQKTKWGLRIRACGEYPEAADSSGINVIKMRYQGVIISGIFSGMGGVFVVLMSSGNFTKTIILGTGFIALAVLISGKWNPFGILIFGLFFGIFRQIAITVPIYFSELPIPAVVFLITPYLITIIILVLFSKSSRAPEALGKPFIKE